MFWDKGYAPSANIEALLEKENVTVEEFLDEEDILQECKTQKKNIVNYFTRPEIIKRLVELVTSEPSEDLPMAQRFRYANMACEILTIGLPSLDEKLLSDANTLKLLYSYLEKEPPLNSLLSSFFSKTFSMLFTKKAEQDWFLYQQMCLQLLEYLKTQQNFLQLICKHFDTPVIPDLIMQMMKDVEGSQLKRNLYEWLTEDKLVERLIEILRNPQETEKHDNVADFFCDLIQQGRLMRQTEQENDSFEPAFDGSNPILKNIESAETIEALLNVILEPNALESAILSGISVVLMLIKPITFTDEPNSDLQRNLQNRERETHLQVQDTVINVIAPRLKEFVALLKNPPAKPEVATTAVKLSPPFGKTRLHICRIFTALLEIKNEKVIKAVCETEYFTLLLDYFKEYCWNNFVHSELEKALHIVFYTQLSNNNMNSTAASDNSYEKHMTNDDYVFNCFMKSDDEEAAENAKNAAAMRVEGGGVGGGVGVDTEIENEQKTTTPVIVEDDKIIAILGTAETTAAGKLEQEAERSQSANNESKVEADAAEAENIEKQQLEDADVNMCENQQIDEKQAETADSELVANNELDKTKSPKNEPPSEIQTHLIVQCQLITRLIEFWQYNNESEAKERGRRLGYMGHLIKILKYITNSITDSELFGALIESNIRDEAELKSWQSIIDPENGEFTKALNIQCKLLANCNPHEESDYTQQVPKDFLSDTTDWDFLARTFNNLGTFNDSNVNDIVFTIDDDQNIYQFGSRNIDDDDDEDDENAAAGGGDARGLFAKNSVTLANLASSDGSGGSPWEDVFSELNVAAAANWGAEFGSDNFADFDAHFSTFNNDLGLQEDGNNADVLENEEDEKEKAKAGNQVMHTFVNNQADILKQQNKAEKTQEIEAEQDLTTRTMTSDAEVEFDNNANLEKSSKFNKSDDQKTTITTTATATTTPNAACVAFETPTHVNRFQSVLLDGEDDYEDDEGMWTKPLGGSAANKNDEELQQENEVMEQQSCDEITNAALTNGPSSKQSQQQQQMEEVNNLTSKENSIAAAAATEHQDQSALEQKLAANTNNIELATTST